MDDKYAIDLEHVVRIYKRDEFEVRALDDVTIQIPPARFVAIMGPSGSGKTTMLNLIAGIDHATTGRVAVGGEEITGMKERDLAGWRARHIGLVFQFYNLIPVLTAFENVAADRSSGLRSRGRLSPTRPSSWLTNRPAISMRSRPRRFSGCWWISTGSSTRRS